VSIFQTVAPTQLPVSLDEVKSRLKIYNGEQDDDIVRALRAAVEYCQEYQWAQFCTATFVERFDRFPCEFRPQRSPLLTVTSLAYNDSANVAQTLTANTHYTVDIYSKPGRIVPAYNFIWPATYGHVNDVTLTYTAGYGAPESVPDEIKHAILLKVVQQYGDCDGASMAAADMAIHAMLDKRSFRVFY
jgi:uncharacterized phiE125 gp8 family phage protein